MITTKYGLTFDLTWQQMRHIYNSMALEYLTEDIESKAEDMEIDLSGHNLNSIAKRVRKTLENNDSFWESYWMSIEDVLEEVAKEA